MDLKSTVRLSELDWLRVILILAVFIHHVLMPFNGDDWHIMNNESSKVLDDIMVYFEQFRLPMLFFISGVGAVILLSKLTVLKFTKDKVLRLFIPLLVGSLLVIPPQTYIENINAMQSYWREYPALALKFETNHLWFIEYLFVFFLLAIPLNKLFASSLGTSIINALQKLSNYKTGLYSLVILLIIIKVYFSLMFPSDDKKIENLSSSAFYFFFFIAGMLFIRSKVIWQAICEQRFYNLLLLFFSTILFYAYYYSPDLSEYLSQDMRWSIWWLVCCLVAWSAFLTILGYAQCYFTKTPKWLSQSNELIYPFYIFHQTVIVVIGYYVIAWQAPISLKIIALLALSFLITSIICWFIIKPFRILRLLFGLKAKKNVVNGLSPFRPLIGVLNCNASTEKSNRMITKLEHSNEAVAEQIHTVFQNSYKVEAELIGVLDFPPLSRSVSDIVNAKTTFYGFSFIDSDKNCLAAVIEIEINEKHLAIDSLTVMPNFFRKGIADKLISYALTSFDIDAATVETAVVNKPAIKLYEKHGFMKFKRWTPSHGIEKLAMSVEVTC